MFLVLSSDDVTLNKMDNNELHNEKLRFKLLLEMIDRLQKIPFQSEVGKSLQADMIVCYGEIIRPIIVEKMKELVKQ